MGLPKSTFFLLLSLILNAFLIGLGLFWIFPMVQVQTDAPSEVSPQPLSEAPPKNALFHLPFDADDSILGRTAVVYDVQGRVKTVSVDTSGAEPTYVVEVMSLDGRSSQTFQIPEQRVIVNEQTPTGEYVAPGDNVFLVVSFDPSTPEKLNIGSFRVTHLP